MLDLVNHSKIAGSVTQRNESAKRVSTLDCGWVNSFCKIATIRFASCAKGGNASTTLIPISANSSTLSISDDLAVAIVSSVSKTRYLKGKFSSKSVRNPCSRSFSSGVSEWKDFQKRFSLWQQYEIRDRNAAKQWKKGLLVVIVWSERQLLMTEIVMLGFY